VSILQEIVNQFLLKPWKISDRAKNTKKGPQNKDRRFLRARVNLVQLTLPIASAHYIALINQKTTTQIGIE
jgi:hypothetical protein